MPFPNTRLDNVFPSTWESVWDGTNPELDDPYIDSETRCRFNTGEDAVNYFTSQRFQGDLFKRDLINGAIIRRIIDYLAARSGYFINTPAISLRGQTYLPLGSLLGTDPIAGYYVVAMSLNLDSGTPSDLEVRLVDLDSGDTLYSYVPSGVQNLFWLVTDPHVNGGRGDLVDNFEVRLINNGSSTVVVQASAVVAPKMAWDAPSGTSSSSSSSP